MKIKSTYHKKMVFTIKKYGPLGIEPDEIKEVEDYVGDIILKNKYIEKVEEDQDRKAEKSERGIEDLGFTPRVEDGLRDLGISSVEELTKMDLNDIKKIDGIGDKTVEDIEEKVNNLEDKKVVNKEIN